MTGVIVLGLHQGHVIYETTDGQLQSLSLLHHSAIDTAIHAGDVSELGDCTYRDRWVQCDGPALTTNDKDQPTCYAHGSVDKDDI